MSDSASALRGEANSDDHVDVSNSNKQHDHVQGSRRYRMAADDAFHLKVRVRSQSRVTVLLRYVCSSSHVKARNSARCLSMLDKLRKRYPGSPRVSVQIYVCVGQHRVLP